MLAPEVCHVRTKSRRQFFFCRNFVSTDVRCQDFSGEVLGKPSEKCQIPWQIEDEKRKAPVLTGAFGCGSAQGQFRR
jgi:hypothetical protein